MGILDAVQRGASLPMGCAFAGLPEGELQPRVLLCRADDSCGRSSPGCQVTGADSLYDMAGNVSEWCNNWRTCDPSEPEDPTGPSQLACFGYCAVARGSTTTTTCCARRGPATTRRIPSATMGFGVPAVGDGFETLGFRILSHGVTMTTAPAGCASGPTTPRPGTPARGASSIQTSVQLTVAPLLIEYLR